MRDAPNAPPSSSTFIPTSTSFPRPWWLPVPSCWSFHQLLLAFRLILLLRQHLCPPALGMNPALLFPGHPPLSNQHLCHLPPDMNPTLLPSSLPPFFTQQLCSLRPRTNLALLLPGHPPLTNQICALSLSLGINPALTQPDHPPLSDQNPCPHAFGINPALLLVSAKTPSWSFQTRNLRLTPTRTSSCFCQTKNLRRTPTPRLTPTQGRTSTLRLNLRPS